MSLLKKLGMSLATFGLASAINLELRLYARDIYVPRDYANIHAGIDAADEGDRVLVAPGEYVINTPINFNGKAITLKSEQGPERTIIRMQDPSDEWYSSVVVFNHNEGPQTVLEGFTLTGGGGTLCIDDACGGGIFCENSSPIIKRNLIVENTAYWGGGIACYRNASPLIINCTITNNQVRSHPGGIFIDWNSQPLIKNSVLWNNLDWKGEDSEILNESLGDDHFRYPKMFYSLIFDEICSKDYTKCDIPLYNENRIIYNQDPLFINAKNNNFHLQPGSPCIDAGSPDSPLDPDGTRADMGAIYFDQIKNRFIRGDANRDGKVDISDAVTSLYHLFKGRKLECKDAADVNDDGKIDVADPIHLLDYLFRDGPLPPEPFLDEGYDFTHDNIGCYVPKLFGDD